MTKKAKRPVDVKDMPWSYMGRDALDAAAEQLWEGIREETDADIYPYSWGSEQQLTAQRAVLSVIGSAVPAILRQRAKGAGTDAYGRIVRESMNELADELESDHG